MNKSDQDVAANIGREQDAVGVETRGPDANAVQGVGLAPEDVAAARRSVAEQDRLAEAPPRDVQSARERFDEAVRDVQGTPPPAGTPGAEPAGSLGLFDAESLAGSTRPSRGERGGAIGRPEEIEVAEAEARLAAAERRRSAAEGRAMEIEPAWPQAPRETEEPVPVEERAAAEPTETPSGEISASTVETVVRQFFGLDRTNEGREDGSAPKGGYFDVERSK